MENIKRAIILDMDETLEYGILQGKYVPDETGTMMTLRPGLDRLIEKLREAKTKSIDVILCTTAHDTWVERFLTLKPEFREILDKLYTKDNKRDWNNNWFCYQKPVETFGYDSILFIDDNVAEKYRLCDIYEDTQTQPAIDITYFSGFKFREQIDIYDLFIYMEHAKQDNSFFSELQELLEIVRSEPGCDIMCLAIDNFIEKEFEQGLTIVDEKYSQEYAAFQNKRDELLEKMKIEQFGKEHTFISKSNLLSEEQIAELTKYMKSDKKIPFEGIERILLSKLLQDTRETQSKLSQAQELEEDYRKNMHKNPVDEQQL